MRILLDESLPRRLRHSFAGHEVVTVVEAGWSGIENGELPRLAATRFDIFVTADQNLQFQQNVSALPITGRDVHAVCAEIWRCCRRFSAAA